MERFELNVISMNQFHRLPRDIVPGEAGIEKRRVFSDFQNTLRVKIFFLRADLFGGRRLCLGRRLGVEVGGELGGGGLGGDAAGGDVDVGQPDDRVEHEPRGA